MRNEKIFTQLKFSSELSLWTVRSLVDWGLRKSPKKMESDECTVLFYILFILNF